MVNRVEGVTRPLREHPVGPGPKRASRRDVSLVPDRGVSDPPDCGRARWRAKDLAALLAHPRSVIETGGAATNRDVLFASVRRRTLRMLDKPSHSPYLLDRLDPIGSYGRSRFRLTCPPQFFAPAGSRQGDPGGQLGDSTPSAAITSASTCDRGGMPGMCSGATGSARAAIVSHRWTTMSRNSW
jgi:hypothetical protein